jgi:hypothetical protein
VIGSGKSSQRRPPGLAAGGEAQAMGRAGGTAMRQSGRVKTAYMAEYADPIIVSAGEALGVDDRVETWDGNPQWIWVWCSDPRGR